MRISDWSSDVCSSDLASVRRFVRFQDDGSVRDIAEVGRGSLGLSAAGTDAVGDDPGMAASWQIDISACNPLIEIISREGRTALPSSEEHTSELQSLMRISYAVFCLKKNTKQTLITTVNHIHVQTNQYDS